MGAEVSSGAPGAPVEDGHEDGRRQRWRAHRVTRRAELIAAVVSVVDAVGADVGMDVISAESGFAKPVFYRYFRDKADLFRSVGETVAEQLVTEVAAAIAAEQQPRAQLAAGIDAFLLLVESSPALYRFVQQLPAAGRTGDGSLIADYSNVIGVNAERVIGAGLRSAGRDTSLAETWGFAIVGAVRTAAERWLDHPTVSRNALTEQLTELLWSGLRARS